MTERPTALTRAHVAIEALAEMMYGRDPSQAEIVAHVTRAMNPPTYPEPTEVHTRVAVGSWRDHVYQLDLRTDVGLKWSQISTGDIVEWWEICEKGAPDILTSSPIEANPS